MAPTLREVLESRPNDVDHVRADFVRRTGHSWNAPTPPELARGSRVSVVLPARDRAHCMRAVLDALAAQRTEGWFEVVVVDDGSVDGTSDIIRRHPVVGGYVRCAASRGAATARNIGTVLATGDTVLYVDADMVLPPTLLADFGARSRPDTVLIGFREAIPAQGDGARARTVIPPRRPRLWNDYRARFRAPAGEPLWYSGRVLPEPVEIHALDETDDFRTLGHGRLYYDTDLPRMVFSALVAMPRAAVLDVGGFEPEFSRRGWGFEDTHLGAKLIASGLTVIPLRQAVGFHVYLPQVPETDRKRAGWEVTLDLYRELLARPVPAGQRERLEREVADALAGSPVSPGAR
jgi:glycosyltransferase involved in cell wall biosynthesis